MKKLLMKIVSMCFMAVIVCPYVTAKEKLDMVKIPGKNFLMLRTEVTQELYESVMGKNPSKFKAKNRPVETVSWYDAIYFCNKLSEKKGLQPVYAVNCETNIHKWNYIPYENYIYGKITQDISADGYRLPTVKEWIYAARGGKSYSYSGSDNLDSVGWYTDNSGNVTHPVAQKRPNDYGLYDMSGNVWEWCWDFYNYGRAMCGGSKEFDADYCMVDSCIDFEQSFYGEGLGFRIVRTIR